MLLNPLTPDEINARLAGADVKAAVPGITDAKAKKIAKFLAETPELASVLLWMFTITNPVTVEIPPAVES